MRPSPLRWWGQLGLIVAALLGIAVAVASWRGRAETLQRRLVGAAFGGAAFVLSCGGIFTGGVAQGDNMGVAGQLSGTALTAAGLFGYLLVPLAMVSPAAALLPLVSRPAKRFRAVGDDARNRPRH